MADVNLTTVFDIMRKPYYDNLVQKVFAIAVPIFKRVKQSESRNIIGPPGHKKIIMSYETKGVYRGVHAALESDNWPIPSDLGFSQAEAQVQYLYMSASLSMIAANEVSGRGALVEAVQRVITSLMDAGTLTMGRMIMGDGSGLVATVTSVSSNVLTVSPITYFVPGQFIWAFYSTGCPAPTNGRRQQTADTAYPYAFRIDDVDYENSTITVQDAGDIAANDSIYFENCVVYNTTTGAITSKEWTGLSKIISNTGTLQNIDRDSVAWYRSYVNTDTSNRAISYTLLNSILETVVYTRQKPIPEEFVCSPGVFTAFANMLLAANAPTDSIPTKLGFGKGLKYVYFGDSITFWGDRCVPANTMYGLRKDAFEFGETIPMGLNRDGGLLKVDGTQAYYKLYGLAAGQLLGKWPMNLEKVDKITEA